MDIELLDHQWDALHSESKNTLLLSGIGGGKTWTGCHWTIKRCLSNKKSLGFIGANTYGQLRNSTLAALFSELQRLNISFSYNQSSGILEYLGKKWLCKSMDNPDVLRGIEVGEIWLDEAAFMSREAWHIISGRLRDKKGSLTTFLTSSPNGFNWLYDYFHPSGELHSNDYKLIKASSYANKFLPDGYLDALSEQYDEKLLQQELMGEFISITQGQVYYAFNYDKNVKEFNKPDMITEFIGMDFNVDPFCSTVGFLANNKLYIWDEFYLRNSDTYKMSYEIRKRGYGGATVIPDSTAKNRKTSGSSDMQILKDEGFTVEWSRNPFVKDRVNRVNNLLDKGRIVIHPRCKKLINDLEQVSWKEGKNELDGSNLELTHVSDALGYMAYRLLPHNTSKDRARAIY